MQNNSTRPQIYFYGTALLILLVHIPGFPRFIQTPITVLSALILMFLTYKVFSNKGITHKTVEPSTLSQETAPVQKSETTDIHTHASEQSSV